MTWILGIKMFEYASLCLFYFFFSRVMDGMVKSYPGVDVVSLSLCMDISQSEIHRNAMNDAMSSSW